MALRTAQDWKRPVVVEVGASNSFGQMMVWAEAVLQKTQPPISPSHGREEPVAHPRQAPSELEVEVLLGMARSRR